MIPTPILAALAVLANLAFLSSQTHGQTPETPDYDNWPVLMNPFPSTGGGGVMIDGYDPVIVASECRTPFRAILPDGSIYRNRIVFDAVPMRGGILCRNGRWKSDDGSAEGTTPFEVFIKGGVVRRRP
jgi:hypothetical protein